MFGALINGSASSQRAALVFGDAYPGARKGSIAIIQSALRASVGSAASAGRVDGVSSMGHGTIACGMPCPGM